MMSYDFILLSSGIMTFVTVALSTNLILQHLNHWKRPIQQKNIIRIIILAPLYAVNCFIGLLELQNNHVLIFLSHVLDVINECYEAIALHSFLCLMYDIVGIYANNNTKKQQLPDNVKGRVLYIPFPLNIIFHHRIFDTIWFDRLRYWTLQFVLLRPLLSIIDLLCVNVVEIHHPAKILPAEIIRIVVTVLLHVSITVAFYSLLIFYFAFQKELKLYRPLYKFLSIKGIVFFTNRQRLIIKLLSYFDVLHDGYRFSVRDVQEAYPDFVLCIEMGIIFLPLYYYAFPPSEYYNNNNNTNNNKAVVGKSLVSKK